MNITEAVNIACKQPTLLDALSFICVWESERIVKQALSNYRSGLSGSNGTMWDTCFKVCLKNVLENYKEKV
jgi:hypothetical protein